MRYILKLKWGLLVAGMLLTIVGTAHFTVAESSWYHNLTPQESYQLVQENLDNPNFIVIDVRKPEEVAQGYLPNAVTIDYLGSGFQEKLNRLDRQKTYLVYCRSGNRSTKALSLMEGMGFNNVYHMMGGLNEWQTHQLPLVQ